MTEEERQLLIIEKLERLLEGSAWMRQYLFDRRKDPALNDGEKFILTPLMERMMKEHSVQTANLLCRVMELIAACDGHRLDPQ